MWVNPKNQMIESEYQMVTGGGGINFWKIEGSHLSKKAGRFGKKFKQAPITTVANLNTKDGWRIIAGTSTGDLLSFQEREVTNGVEKAHTGALLCLAEVRNGCTYHQESLYFLLYYFCQFYRNFIQYVFVFASVIPLLHFFDLSHH